MKNGREQLKGRRKAYRQITENSELEAKRNKMWKKCGIKSAVLF